jgi:transposase InsO family protein
MGIKSRDWKKIGDYISKIKSEDLTYKEGAKRFGLKVSDIYEYNKRFKNKSFERGPGMVRNWTKIGEYVSRIEDLGMTYVDGAAHFGISVSSIYKYNSQIKGKNKEKSRSDEMEREKDLETESSARAGSADGDSIGAGDSICKSQSCTEVASPVSPLTLSESENKNKNENEISPSLERESVKSSAANSTVKVNAGNGANVVGNVDLPPGVADLIINYRQEHPAHGYKRIGDYLKNRYFVVVPRKKIRELLKLHGLTGDSDSSFDQSSVNLNKADKGTRRFEASYPRELYQMDITYVYLVNQTICYLVVVLDDYSRFCVSCELRRDYRTISMIEVLHRGIERYGKPCKLLTDQGSSFYSWSREQTLFSRYLDDMKIEHIVADPHSPQTLGKVERFHQTIQRELLDKSHFLSYEEARQRIESYMHQYNYERPHQGIGGAFPASRFQGIIGETSRIESELCGKSIDFSRGYLVFKMFEHTISIVCNGGGLQVFLDGDLLRRNPGAQSPPE